MVSGRGQAKGLRSKASVDVLFSSVLRSDLPGLWGCTGWCTRPDRWGRRRCPWRRCSPRSRRRWWFPRASAVSTHTHTDRAVRERIIVRQPRPICQEAAREATLRHIHLHVARQTPNTQPPPPPPPLSCLPGVTQVLLCL